MFSGLFAVFPVLSVVPTCAAFFAAPFAAGWQRRGQCGPDRAHSSAAKRATCRDSLNHIRMDAMNTLTYTFAYIHTHTHTHTHTHAHTHIYASTL